MCKLCEEKPVYEFTNQRKLCKRCFINYFYKKALFTLRKFNLTTSKDIIGYKKENTFRGVVLEDVLEFISKKYFIKILLIPNKKATKLAVSSSLDSESEKIVNILINEDSSHLGECSPKIKNIIKPLYLFLDKEILLFAKLKNLNFKEPKENHKGIEAFIDFFEKNHPEVKRAIVNSFLKLYT
jgi:hypothetical protein